MPALRGADEVYVQGKPAARENRLDTRRPAQSFAGALCADIFVCPDCGKLEFYIAEGYDSPQDDELPKKTCPDCGKEIDFDSPKCPFCRYEFRYL